MMAAFAATSFTYSFLGQPLFLVIARQQCWKSPISATDVFRDVIQTHGWRGLYRGAGTAIAGTVVSELVYYLTVEYGKERIPFQEHEWRSFGAGLMADVTSTPVFNPFAVVSQVQMVAGSAFSSDHNYMSAWRTTHTLVREQGVRCLFRGTLLTLVVSPLTGAWWFLYESLKRRAYAAAPALGQLASAVVPRPLRDRAPPYLVSTTDNVLINSSVGGLTSIVVGIVMNPLYVIRLRLQVGKSMGKVRFPILHILREVYQHEGYRAFWKGLGVNLFMGVIGGCAFGATYEGAKQLSDTRE
ncbi:carrier protein [Strigomonas culicis]|nr:carrier protein [Strigomonas culicis]|eukprot:EPY28252.1 carrier protein [Strigomonas culicis]